MLLDDRWWVVRFNVFLFYLIIFFLVSRIIRSRIFEVDCYILIVYRFHVTLNHDI